MCHLPPPQGSMTSAAMTSTRISENRRPFGVAFEVVGRLVPAERRVEHQRQEQVVAVVDHDQLAAGTLLGRVVDQVFLRALGADVALDRELAGDDLFDRDFLVPAVAAVFLLAARLRDLFGAAQRAARLDDRSCVASPNCNSESGTSTSDLAFARAPAHTSAARILSPSAEPRTAARPCGSPPFTVAIQRCGTFERSRS